MRKAYQIEISVMEPDLLYYPEELNVEEPITTVCFGNLSENAKALPYDNKRKIMIGANLAKKLLIPDLPLKLHAFVKNGVLFIGPIVGIFTAGFTPYPKSPIGGRSISIAKLISTYEKAGVFPIVFGIQHIHWDRGTVTGYFFNRQDWMKLEVPLPNVIYDKLPNRKVANLKSIQTCKETFEKVYLIPWYNPGFFNKIEVYRNLSSSNLAKQYLPDFSPLEHFGNLEDMLNKYDLIYIKPNQGSFGKGVYEIKKGKQGIVFCHFRDETGKIRLLKFPSLERLYSYLRKKHPNIDFCIQQGIAIQSGDVKLDFRIHTNKNEEGKWQVAAIGGKRVELNSPTTHILSGGSVISLDEVFPDPLVRKEKEKMLTEAAILLSTELEKHTKGVLAEIGFDIGMDPEGKIWLFEANSKPGPAIFKHPKLKKFERKTYHLNFSFAVHLTEKTIQQPETIYGTLL